MQKNTDAWIDWCVLILLIVTQVTHAMLCVTCDRLDVCFLWAVEILILERLFPPIRILNSCVPADSKE